MAKMTDYNIGISLIKREFFEYMQQTYHFKITPLSPENTYYYDNTYNNSITNFYIKGCRHWRFGLWIRPYTNNDTGKSCYNISFFAKYEGLGEQNEKITFHFINKFKPSDAHLIESFSVQYIVQRHKEGSLYQYFFLECSEIIRLVQRHPFLAYYMSTAWYKYPICPTSFLRYFLQDRIGHTYYFIKWRIKDKISDALWQLEYKFRNMHK